MPASRHPQSAEQFRNGHGPEDGLPRRWKLLLIELAGLVLLGFAVRRIALDSDWAHGVPVLVLGAYVLLSPAQIGRFIERFLPGKP